MNSHQWLVVAWAFLAGVCLDRWGERGGNWYWGALSAVGLFIGLAIGVA